MTHLLNPVLIRQRLEKTTATYLKHAVVQREVAKRILERLDYIKYTPRTILDLSLHGIDSEAALRQRFPKATYIAGMPFFSGLSQRRSTWFKRPMSVCMPFDLIPLKNGSIDFIFMNVRLLWSNDWAQLLRECRRVLKSNGMLLFSTLGPDTLRELRQAFAQVDAYAHVHSLVDMHDIGDVLVGAGFQNPVMDMEPLVMQYASYQMLMDDLRLTATQNALVDRSKGLMTPRQWARVQSQYPRDGVLWPATFEIIYGHAWAGEHMPQRTNDAGDVLVSLESLKRR